MVKRIIGFVLLSAFLSAMGYKLISIVDRVENGFLVLFLVFVVILIILMGIMRIIQE